MFRKPINLFGFAVCKPQMAFSHGIDGTWRPITARNYFLALLNFNFCHWRGLPTHQQRASLKGYCPLSHHGRYNSSAASLEASRSTKLAATIIQAVVEPPPHPAATTTPRGTRL